MSHSIYQTPESDVSSREDLTGSLLLPLSQTKPWARLISILSFIAGAFMILVAVGMMFAAGPAGMNRGISIGMGAVYLLLSLFYILPGIFLFRYASAIADAVTTQTSADIVRALTAQKSFWKFAGIVALIMLVLAILGVVAAVVMPMLFVGR